MMKFLRNPEVKRTLLIYIAVSALFVAAAFVLNTYFALLMAAASAVFILIYLLATYKRYRRIASLAADIDLILHGDRHIALGHYAEGELGILQSEINKMTVRLREQQHTLQNDKLYLADSLADISHQLRTPLTSINLLVSLLSEPDLPDERRQKLTHELYELLSRIDRLITTLLKISKLDAGTAKFQAETIPLAELLRQATVPLLVPMELRGQTLRITADGDILCDISWTCEAITNIVKNCMEHTPENGTITIDAHDNALYTEIAITDNGGGIHKDDLPHIFERFYKGKAADDKGFGIGLALARMIVTTQNGTIKAQNRTPHGAEFILRFYKSTV